MSKMDQILQSAQMMSDEMKQSQQAFEEYEVEKNIPLPNDQGSISLSMNGKYELTLVIDNPNDNNLNSNHLAEAILMAHQGAVHDLQVYSKNQMHTIAQMLNETHSQPPHEK
ncbi:MAG TPA: YbaB/EbfC family nucleoid-associated protein [Gammaproteobacteria bacterium]|nr:YbaB/EbfC family nucleoid-associated protein [Gammaproteobacteria bacterium]